MLFYCINFVYDNVYDVLYMCYKLIFYKFQFFVKIKKYKNQKLDLCFGTYVCFVINKKCSLNFL